VVKSYAEGKTRNGTKGVAKPPPQSALSGQCNRGGTPSSYWGTIGKRDRETAGGGNKFGRGVNFKKKNVTSYGGPNFRKASENATSLNLMGPSTTAEGGPIWWQPSGPGELKGTNWSTKL